MRWGASCVESDVDSPESSRSWLLVLASHPSAKNAEEWGPLVICDLELHLEWVGHLLPKPFTVFVEGVSQAGKSPVCGLVVLCGQEPGTELADFGFGGSRGVGESPI
jgi:hypothetical protein